MTAHSYLERVRERLWERYLIFARNAQDPRSLDGRLWYWGGIQGATRHLHTHPELANFELPVEFYEDTRNEQITLFHL